MKLIHTLVAICCFTILLAACKKEENNNNSNNNNNNNPAPSTKAQLLIDGKWQMSASTATVNYMGKDTTVDYYATEVEDCEKDNFILFAANGTCTQDENTNKCSGKPQLTAANWALLDNDSRIALVDSNPDTFDVEITSTEWKLKWTGKNSSGTPIYNVETYKNIK
jgi:hypothetical protein